MLYAILPILFVATGTVIGTAINITVGGPGVLKYNPEFVNANPGDVINFIFQQKNHTATQSSFGSPCSHLSGGFDSGFVPVADAVTTGFPVAKLTVTDSSPIWVYCRQANHCQQGMVFAINPGSKFAAFQAAATGTSSASTSGASTASTTSSTATLPVSVASTQSASASLPTSTTTGSTDHRVVVGGLGQLTYSPSNITAQVGDTVTFEFHQKNHTVTASSFAAPCRALSLTSTTGAIGFDSGFMPVSDNATKFPTYAIQVNNTSPIWAYCRQATHCGQGMVFSVNAVESGPNNFAAFQALAKKLNGTGNGTTSGSNSGVVPAELHYGVAAILMTFVSFGVGGALWL